MSEEIKQLFEEMIKSLGWADSDIEEAIGHFEDATEIAYKIVMKCRAKGVEPQFPIDPTWPEEKKMCSWALLFARLGEELYKTETPCLMHLAYKLYPDYKSAGEIVEKLKKYVQ